jgi:hypothetical protein
MSEDRSGYIYILKASKPFEECYKIGRTVKPRQRLHNFGVRLPFKFEVVGMYKFPDCHVVERYMHEFFAHKRLDGEWFSLDALDLELIHAAMLFNQALNFWSFIKHNADPAVQSDPDIVARAAWLLPKAHAKKRRRQTKHNEIYEKWKGEKGKR